MAKLMFPSSKSHAEKPFDLIHVDIWDSYRVFTRGKFRYFLTLVDDCTRVTWVYLMEMKSEYLNTLMKFDEYVSNQFGCKIKVVRSGNALEFADKRCSEYFAKKGMIHQKVVSSHTSAECKGGDETQTSA